MAEPRQVLIFKTQIRTWENLVMTGKWTAMSVSDCARIMPRDSTEGIYEALRGWERTIERVTSPLYPSYYRLVSMEGKAEFDLIWKKSWRGVGEAIEEAKAHWDEARMEVDLKLQDFKRNIGSSLPLGFPTSETLNSWFYYGPDEYYLPTRNYGISTADILGEFDIARR